VEARDAAADVLNAYVRQTGAGVVEDGFEDPGPMLLAALVASAGGHVDGRAPIPYAAAVWLRGCGAGGIHLGMCGRGMAGFVLALGQAARTWPELGGLADRARAELIALAAAVPWRSTEVGWEDYDLIMGAAGTLATLAADPRCTPRDNAPLVRHLAGLCADDELSGLRVSRYEDDPERGWNHGRLNAGIGHGVPGVAAGLQVAARVGGLSDVGSAALRRVAAWLVRQSYVDARGVRTWPSAGWEPADLAAGQRVAARHASTRQAWCYGAPGIAWTLWESARALNDPALEAIAVEAAGSFLAAYDDDIYLDERYPDKVGICHGAAGLLLIFDAFDRYAGLPGAGRLRDHLAAFIGERLDRVVGMAEQDLSMIAGATGVLAALLTYGQDDGRQWLAGLGLR
jgi:hypothetical protein